MMLGAMVEHGAHRIESARDRLRTIRLLQVVRGTLPPTRISRLNAFGTVPERRLPTVW